MDNNSNHFPLNLQFFAESDGTGNANENSNQDADSTGGSGAGGNDDQEHETTKSPKVPTFAELLKTDKGFQSEFDKRVDGVLKAAKAKWDEDAKLSADDLAKKKQTEAEEALKTREAALAARELKADMITELGKKGLPAELIDAISLADKDAAAASLAEVEKVFRAAVDAEVKKKMAGTPPPGGNGGADGSSFEAKLRAAAGLKDSAK